MILKIYNNVEVLIDEEDAERITNALCKNAEWHQNKNGTIYGWCCVGLRKKKLILSRVVMRCFEKHLDVDHINHNHLDVRKQNLRVCSHQENCFNTNRPIGASGIKGVSWSKDKQKWTSKIRTKTGRIHLGYFDSSEKAEQAYLQAVLKYHGDFAYKNLIGGVS